MSDDAETTRIAYRALLEKLPETMECSRSLLEASASIGEGLEPGADRLKDASNKLLPRLVTAIIALEHRIELLEGRDGIPMDTLKAIQQEFFPL